MAREINVKILRPRNRHLGECLVRVRIDDDTYAVCLDQVEKVRGFSGYGDYTLKVTPGRGRKLFQHGGFLRTGKQDTLLIPIEKLGLQRDSSNSRRPRRILFELVKKEATNERRRTKSRVNARTGSLSR